MKHTHTNRIIGCICTFILTLSMSVYLGNILSHVSVEGEAESIKAFHQIDSNSTDVIFYGSSHAWKGCDPTILKSKYDIDAFNYGNNWQAINTTTLFIQDSFRTQQPKLVFVETYRIGAFMEDTDLEGEIYNTRYLPYTKEKLQYLRKCFGHNLEGYLSYIFPLVMFHENWSTIDNTNFSHSDIDEWIKRRGYCPSDNIDKISISDYRYFDTEALSDSSIDELDKIINECNSIGADVIFYTVPYEGNYPYIEALSEYARTHNCAYLNLFEYINEIGLDPETDYRDWGHLNDSGAAKVTNFLGQYIITNYDTNTW